jgi:hypothetical protein
VFQVKKNDTGNCKKHLKRVHHAQYQIFLAHQGIETTKPPPESPSNLLQPTLPQALSRSAVYSADSERQKNITTALARAFAGNSLSHLLIENDLFRQALSVMDRRYVPPARDGMKKYIIAQSELLKEKMHQLLASAPKISLCVDLWTKRALTQTFIGITAHLIDKTRGLVRLLLSVKEITGKHTADNISENVLETLSEWNIADEKVRCIITDNGSNIVKAFREWQEVVEEGEMVQ